MICVERLRPLNDFVFKKLFGEEDVLDNLIAFLNAVLDRKWIERLVGVEIVDNKELLKEGSDVEFVTKITKLTLEEVKEIKKILNL